MPKVTAAEWFLSLFTTRDRASAIAGDLAEQGRVSWLNILRTGGSLFLRSAIAQPWRLGLLFLLGLVLEIAAWQLYMISIHAGFITRSTALIYWLVSYLALPALIGHVIARFARGREITACMAYVLLHALLVLSCALAWRAPFLWFFISWISTETVQALLILAVGALTRRRPMARRLSHAH